jgi:hypothetical protein
MRTRLPIAVIATAAVSATVFGVLNVGAQINPGVEATPERCTPPKGSGFRLTVMSNTYGRVWIKQTTRNNTVYRKYYACSNFRRRHVYLATSRHQDLVDEGDTPPFSSVFVNERALDEGAVAFTKTSCNPAGENARCSYLLRWIRFRDGKVLREFKTAGAERPTTPVIQGEGFLFWLVDTDRSTGPECGAQPCEIRMAGIRGDRVIDSGSNMSALGITGGTVTWRKGDDLRGLDIFVDPPAPLD